MASSRGRNFLRNPRLEPLEMDPDIAFLPDFDPQRVEPATARAFPADFTRLRKFAVMAGTIKSVARGLEFDGAPEMRTGRIERVHFPFTNPPQKNRADRV